MRAKEIIPKKKPAEPVAETDGSMSAIPGRSLRPPRSKQADAKRNVENIIAGGAPAK